MDNDELCAVCLLGDEPPNKGEMRDGTGEPECVMCDECYNEWLRGQIEPVQY